MATTAHVAAMVRPSLLVSSRATRPVPRQKLVELKDLVPAMRASTSASQACGSTSFTLAVTIRPSVTPQLRTWPMAAMCLRTKAGTHRRLHDSQAIPCRSATVHGQCRRALETQHNITSPSKGLPASRQKASFGYTSERRRGSLTGWKPASLSRSIRPGEPLCFASFNSSSLMAVKPVRSSFPYGS